MAVVLLCFVLGAVAISVVAFRFSLAGLQRPDRGKTPRGGLWLATLIGLLFGAGAVIAMSQFSRWRGGVLVASGEKAYRNREMDKAVAEFNEAIRLNPSLAVAFNDRGVVWLEKGDYDKAIADCSEALRMKPTLANALLNRGQAWNEKGEYEKGLADCSEAIRLDPKLANAFNNRAIAWIGKGEFDEALHDCNEAIRLDPKLANAFNNRAIAWIGKSEFDRAVGDCDEALRLDPTYDKAFINRGSAWDGKGEYGKAAADLTDAIRINPQLAEAYDAVAWLRATCADQQYRDGKVAVENASKACALSAWRNPNHLETLAAAYAEAGDFANAVNWEQKAIELTPKELVSEQRLALDLYGARKPMRQPDVHDLADCVWAWAAMQTRHNLSRLLASFKASRVGVGVPPNEEPIEPNRQTLKSALRLIPASTLPDGTRCLVVLADVKNLAAHERKSRFAEVAASDVIQLAVKERSGILIQILTPGRAAFAAISHELVLRIGRAPWAGSETGQVRQAH